MGAILLIATNSCGTLKSFSMSLTLKLETPQADLPPVQSFSIPLCRRHGHDRGERGIGSVRPSDGGAYTAKALKSYSKRAN